MATRIPARLTVAEGRKFGLTVGLAFLALGGLVLWRGRERVAFVFFTVGGALVLAGLVVPTSLGPVQRGWMALAQAISKVTTPIIMGVIFFVVLTPIGILRRMLGGNPLTTQQGRASAWVSRAGKPRGDLQRQF